MINAKGILKCTGRKYGRVPAIREVYLKTFDYLS
jgi:hypothetical protein